MSFIIVVMIHDQQGFIHRPQKLDRGQVAALEMGIQRRADDLLSVGDQMKGVRQETRNLIEEGSLKFFERRRRNKLEAAEFNQFKQASGSWPKLVGFGEGFLRTCWGRGGGEALYTGSS